MLLKPPQFEDGPILKKQDYGFSILLSVCVDCLQLFSDDSGSQRCPACRDDLVEALEDAFGNS